MLKSVDKISTFAPVVYKFSIIKPIFQKLLVVFGKILDYSKNLLDIQRQYAII